MTIKKFYGIFFVQLVLFTLLRIWFFGNFNYQDGALQLGYWVAVGVATVILIRAIGVMNYLEAIYTAMFWAGFDLLADLLVTASLTSLNIFSSRALWAGYLIMMVLIFIFHQKRHVHIRRGTLVEHHSH